jgi:carboxyl-terminal processing protease
MPLQAILFCLVSVKAALETKAALEEQRQVLKIILDLGNPGGLLNEAINICNLFVPKRGYSNYEIENRNTIPMGRPLSRSILKFPWL